MTCYASADHFLSQLHALLRVLTQSSRHKVITHMLTEEQRRDLEHWMLKQQSIGVEESITERCAMSIAIDDLLRPQDLNNNSSSEGKHKVNRLRQHISKSGNCYVASVYAKWLEIRGPMRHSLNDASNDYHMLKDIKQFLLNCPDEVLVRDDIWHVLAHIIEKHGQDPVNVRARVMVPAELWIGVRLATPHQNLKESLHMWGRLRSHLSWKMLGENRNQTYQGKSVTATADHCWAELRKEFIECSVKAGCSQSRLEARLQHLEERHLSVHGSLDNKILRRVSHLVKREAAKQHASRSKQVKEWRAQKRKSMGEQKRRTLDLAQRMRKEKTMTMDEILGKRKGYD